MAETRSFVAKFESLVPPTPDLGGRNWTTVIERARLILWLFDATDAQQLVARQGSIEWLNLLKRENGNAWRELYQRIEAIAAGGVVVLVPITSQIAEAKREFSYRLSVYARLIAAGRMSRQQADHQLAAQSAIIRSLEGIGE